MAPKKPAKHVRASTQVGDAAQRRKHFAEAYLTNGGNATKAAMAVGFSPKTAHAQGSRLLKHVEIQSILQQRRTELAISYELTTEAVVKSLAQAVHFDPRKLYNTDGSLKPIHELDDDTAAALTGFEVTELTAGRGEGTVSLGVTKKVKWLDKNAAREQAMKHLGLYEQDNKQRNPLDGVSHETLKLIAEKLGGKR